MSNNYRIGQIIQFNEKHKWCGTLGFIEQAKKCDDDCRVMIGCTIPNNQTTCDTAYIFSMASKKEFEVLSDGQAALMPGGADNE